MPKPIKYTDEYIKNQCVDKNLTYKGTRIEKTNNKNRKYIDFVCNIHVDKGIQSIVCDKIDKTKQPCGYCNHKKRKETFIDEMKEINPDITILSEFITGEDQVVCKCNICGYEWSTIARGLLSGTGCRQCGYVKAWNKKGRRTTEEARELIKAVQPHIEVIGEYKGAHENILCKCLIHNEIFEAQFSNLQNLNTHGCYKCCISKGEEKMINILKSFGLDIDHQHTFDDCKYINVLKFDGYNDKYNIAFEYQGEQHYEVIDFSGHNPEKAKEDFEKCQLRDNIKKEYCKNNNIRLICVPYWEFDNMEQFLKNELNDILEQ